ncbi:hypothetical protein BsWGS_16419 [Bradybaena similaris]
MEPVILFSSPPIFEELCGITVLVKPSVHSHLASLQPHITKCREIIFTEPDVIASPSSDLDACFNIVMQQSLFKSGRVQARLQKLGCQLSKPYRVLPSLYQACLHYTLLARLAPTWNRAGEWLLQGRDFLMHTGYTHAIKMRLCVNKDEMFVSACGTVVRFPPLQVEDLSLSREEMLQIVKSTEDGVSEVMLADSWCHVLPSMKRGRIMCVSLDISRHSPFTSYRDLQRHWKNMYGYRLPDTDEDILYCQICFLPSGGGKYFTYPNVCLRAGPLQVVQRVDPKPILTTFLQDVHSRVGAVCGTPLRFQSKICFACPSLHMAGEETSHASLSSKPVINPVIPMRSQKSVSHMCHSTSIDRKATVREKLYGQKTEKTKEGMSLVNLAQTERRSTNENEKQGTAREKLYEQNTEKIKENLSLPNAAQTERRLTNENDEQDKENKGDLISWTVRNETVTQQDGIDICHSEFVDQKHNSSLQKNVTKSDSEKHMNTQPAMVTKFVPQFRPKQRCHLDRKTPASENSHPKTFISSNFKPVFKPCLSKATTSTSKKDKLEGQSSETNTAISQPPSSKPYLNTNNSTARAREQGSSQHTPTLVPHFRNNWKHKSLKGANMKPSPSKTAVSHASDLKVVAEKAKHKNPRSIIQSPNHSGFVFPAQASENILLTPVRSVSKASTVSSTSKMKIATERTQPQNSTSIMKSPNNSDLSTQNSNILLTPAHGSAFLAHQPPSTPLLFSKNSQESKGWRKEGTQDGVKRKKVTEEEDTPKKARVKPQIQDLDVEALARSNQLGKVNTATLTAWLKDRGVMCRSKDKKSDLVEKVNGYINAHKPEA